MARVLVVDDEMTMVQTVSELLREEGHEVMAFHSGHDALEVMETQAPDLVITDLFLQKAHPQGLEVLAKARAMHPPVTVILITGYASISTAVEAMKQGAFDYLEKPFKPDDFKRSVQRALTFNRALSENVYLRKQLREKYQFNQIIGSSPRIQDVFKLMERVADTDSTILILGESGTGKELVARALHFNSRRQFAPFIPINCSALPENLLESELFGHRRGSFTGAIQDKKGLFQEADGGTIFLDEIGSMPPLLQSRLLRVLQDKEVRRVGDNIPIHINVRVLAATNEPLEKRIKDGSFREDLYYRLNVIPIHLPPLRDRKEDLPVLVAHFLKKKIDVRSGQSVRVSRQAMQTLSLHDWPGNVRELENAIERGCAICENGMIRIADLPPILQASAARHQVPSELEDAEAATLPAAGSTGDTQPPVRPMTVTAKPGAAPNPALTGKTMPAVESPTYPPSAAVPLKDFLRHQELAYLQRALQANGQDKEKTATLLGISLATLYRKLAGEDTA